MSRPTVAVDVSAVPGDPRGAGRYVVELVKALAARGQVDLRLVARRRDEERWQAWAPSATVHAVVPTPRPARLVWEQVVAPRLVDRWDVDVFHGPHYTMPETARTPKVVTVHDLTLFDHPEWHQRSKVSVFTRAMRVAARRAQALVCVSEATARRLRELLDPVAPVHVVHHGIDHELFAPAGPDSLAADAAALAELGIRPPFVAFVGTLEPRKDLATLVAAFDRVAASADHRELQLVIAGGRGWSSEPFERAVAESTHQQRIVRTGYVADAVVPALFRTAAAVVYPSIAEGFGLPVIEALATGAPTVTTEGSVMEELAAGAAFTVAPRDPDALAIVLDRVVRGGAEVDRRRALGLDVAAAFTWDACAAAHEAVYERTAAAGRPR